MNGIIQLNNYYEEKYDKNINNGKFNNFLKKMGNALNNIYSFHKMKSLSKNVKIDSYFEHKENIRSNKIVIKGTRITPEDIIEDFFRISIDCEKNTEVEIIINKIIEDYPCLNEGQIAAALLYCFKNNKVTKIMKKFRG